MEEFLSRLFAVDMFTLIVAAGLAVVSGILTMMILSRTGLAVMFVPGFFVGALAANYFFQEYGIVPTSMREIDPIINCTVGILVALIIMLALTRFIWGAASLRAKIRSARRS